VHELSIASAILDSVKVEVAKHRNARPVNVGVRIGELSGVDPDALSFGFEVLVKGTDLEPLKLTIKYVSRRQRCNACGKVFTLDGFAVECPACNSTDTMLDAGDELDLVFVELEEAEPEPEVAAPEPSPNPQS
jgi:hydrogenase nickel incorporation protein HypA/HybF